jgi:hypothetical protein
MLADNSRVKKMDRTAVKMMPLDSPGFKEANMNIFMGTPEECWHNMREINRQAMILSGIDPDTVRLRRDIVTLSRLNDSGERVEIIR